MRNAARAIVSMIGLSSVVWAGGDAMKVPSPTVVEEVSPDSGIYIGAGLSGMFLRDGLSEEEFSAVGTMIQVGYQLNQHFAVEGRYTRNVGAVKYQHGKTSNPDNSDYPTHFSNAAIYLKPMYPIGKLSLYALLGYGRTQMTNLPGGGAGVTADRAEGGFQWGVGASYRASRHVFVFADYVHYYHGKGFDYRAQKATINAGALTVGISYRF